MAKVARKKGLIRWLRRYGGRPALLAVLTALCMAGMVFLWPHKVRGMPEARWNQIKSEWRADADVLILGDSRAASSLLPVVMSETLSDLRIKNFAFPGNAYLPGYMDAGLRILDPASKDPTVIFAFSSKSLTPNEEGWPSVGKRTWSEVAKWKYLPGLMSTFKPIGKWEFINVLRGHSELGLWREHRPDGSYIGGATWRKRAPSLEDARTMLLKHHVDENIVADVMRRVTALRADGVQVLGVRLPSSTAIEEIEDSVQNFDEAAFVKRFEEAGGTWISIPDRNAYTTYDLSHMNVPDAERFSRWFAQQMIARTSSTAQDREAR